MCTCTNALDSFFVCSQESLTLITIPNYRVVWNHGVRAFRVSFEQLRIVAIPQSCQHLSIVPAVPCAAFLVPTMRNAIRKTFWVALILNGAMAMIVSMVDTCFGMATLPRIVEIWKAWSDLQPRHMATLATRNWFERRASSSWIYEATDEYPNKEMRCSGCHIFVSKQDQGIGYRTSPNCGQDLEGRWLLVCS